MRSTFRLLALLVPLTAALWPFAAPASLDGATAPGPASDDSLAWSAPDTSGPVEGTGECCLSEPDEEEDDGEDDDPALQGELLLVGRPRGSARVASVPLSPGFGQSLPRHAPRSPPAV